MKKTISDLWLLILILGLPLLSELVYSPALPNIARSLLISESMVEYTLTIYFWGFALGILFWGKLSDKYGRKSSLISGLLICLLGCLGCFFSTTIISLMINRLILGFGCSAGSVLGYAICRDLFKGPKLGQALSIIGSVLSIYVAVGPMFGGLIDQFFGWTAVFLFLFIVGLATLVSVFLKLPETYVPKEFSLGHIKQIFLRMIYDKKVLAFGYLLGAVNGISSCFYAEGSFYLMNILGLSPLSYGFSYLLFALSGLVGGYISKKLHDVKVSSFSILRTGNIIILFGAFLFLILTIIFYFLNFEKIFYIYLTLASVIIIMTGISIMSPNIVSLAVKDYRNAIGTASSLLGFYYYLLVSLFTFIMGLVHNNTIFPMPAYFLAIALSMILICVFLKRILAGK